MAVAIILAKLAGILWLQVKWVWIIHYDWNLILIMIAVIFMIRMLNKGVRAMLMLAFFRG